MCKASNTNTASSKCSLRWSQSITVSQQRRSAPFPIDRFIFCFFQDVVIVACRMMYDQLMSNFNNATHYKIENFMQMCVVAGVDMSETEWFSRGTNIFAVKQWSTLTAAVQVLKDKAKKHDEWDAKALAKNDKLVSELQHMMLESATLMDLTLVAESFQDANLSSLCSYIQNLAKKEMDLIANSLAEADKSKLCVELNKVDNVKGGHPDNTGTDWRATLKANPTWAEYSKHAKSTIRKNAEVAVLDSQLKVTQEALFTAMHGLLWWKTPSTYFWKKNIRHTVEGQNSEP